MSLPAKAEKGYLELTKAGKGFVITGKSQHINELAAILEQHGIVLHRQPDASDDEETLRLERESDKPQTQELLDAYKNAKGS